MIDGEPNTPADGCSGGTKVPRLPRRRVAVSGTLELLSGNITVEVRNLSCKGAMVEADRVPEPGQKLVLTGPGLDCFGKVIWSDGHRCGIEFDEQLSREQVIELHRITPEAVRSAELNAAAEWFQSQGRYARF